MNRRDIVVGLGGMLSVGVLTSGTGAFSSVQVDGRDASVMVVDDSEALIGLIANPEVAGVHDVDGELTIDLAGPNNGINQNSVYQFGYFAESVSSAPGEFPYVESAPSEVTNGEFGSAFLIANQTDNEQTIEIEYELTTEEDDNGDRFDTSFWFEAHNNDNQKGLIEGPTDTPVDATATVTLPSGDACGVSFLLDVPGGTLGERINGSLSITAGEAVDDTDTGGDE